MSRLSAFLLTMMMLFTVLYVDGCVGKLDRTLDVHQEYTSNQTYENKRETTIRCNGLIVTDCE